MVPGAGAGVVTVPASEGRPEGVAFRPEGWDFWEWDAGPARGGKVRVHFLAMGPADGPPVILCHGFGASGYHWRYNLPALARAGFRVYAPCLVGFGWSEKAPDADYSKGTLWAEQLAAFAEEVAGARRDGGDSRRPVLAGNSLGGYSALRAASRYPDLFRGVCLLNSAGRFEDELDWSTGTRAGPAAAASLWAPVRRRLGGAVLRAGLLGAFAVARQPASIRNTLEKVYVSGIDDDLVDSIVLPTADPASPEVFCRVLQANGLGSDNPLSEQRKLTLDPMLRTLRHRGLPLLLLWGTEDPWIRESKLERIRKTYPEAEKVLVQGGHCPHDDKPHEVNAALVEWLSRLEAGSAPAPDRGRGGEAAPACVE